MNHLHKLVILLMQLQDLPSLHGYKALGGGILLQANCKVPSLLELHTAPHWTSPGTNKIEEVFYQNKYFFNQFDFISNSFVARK